jgi:hypothetical protein
VRLAKASAAPSQVQHSPAAWGITQMDKLFAKFTNATAKAAGASSRK